MRWVSFAQAGAFNDGRGCLRWRWWRWWWRRRRGRVAGFEAQLPATADVMRAVRQAARTLGRASVAPAARAVGVHAALGVAVGVPVPHSTLSFRQWSQTISPQPKVLTLEQPPRPKLPKRLVEVLPGYCVARKEPRAHRTVRVMLRAARQPQALAVAQVKDGARRQRAAADDGDVAVLAVPCSTASSVLKNSPR